jgi:hypothetical protein
MIVDATLGSVIVEAVTPAFAMKDWKRTLASAQSAVVTVTGFAASIIAPVIAATLGTVAVTAYPAEIHQAKIDVLCNVGQVIVTGYNVNPVLITGVLVNATLGQVIVTGFDAVGTLATVVKVTQEGVVTVTGYDTIVNSLAVWVTAGQVLVTGYDPEVVVPLIPGFGVGPAPNTSKNYITYYQDWATHFPAEIARRWRQFLLDTFYISTPPTTSGGTANSIELTTDAEITQITVGQSLRFTAAFTNTGSVVLDVNEIGPQIVKYDGQYLKGGEIAVGGSYTVVYDGFYWNLTTSSRSVIGDSGRTWMDSPQELTHANIEPLTWSALSDYDDAGYFQPAGSPIEYARIPENGRYRIVANIGVTTKNDGAGDIVNVVVAIAINGDVINGSAVYSGYVDDHTTWVHLEYINRFSAGDEVSIHVFQRNASSSSAEILDDLLIPADASWFSIERLR